MYSTYSVALKAQFNVQYMSTVVYIVHVHGAWYMYMYVAHLS